MTDETNVDAVVAEDTVEETSPEVEVETTEETPVEEVEAVEEAPEAEVAE